MPICDENAHNEEVNKIKFAIVFFLNILFAYFDFYELYFFKNQTGKKMVSL